MRNIILVTQHRGRELIKEISKTGNFLFESSFRITSVQSLRPVWLCVTPETAARQASIYHQLPELAQSHVHLVGDAIQPSHPLSSPSPTFNFSQHQDLFRWSVRIRPEYWSFTFSIRSSNEYSGLISFTTDVGSPCSPRGSPESSPTPQFKVINSLVLSFLYSPTLTAIHECWKNHGLDCCCCC